MTEPSRPAVTLAQLRLATGTAAELIGPLPSTDRLQLFAARAIDAVEPGATRIVVVHPAPPEGPIPGSLLDRMASIRAAALPSLAAPLATGEVNGQGWIVEPLIASPSVADRMRSRGRLTTSEMITLVGGLVRALAALHRRGIAHGALTLESITIDQQSVTVYHLGRTTAVSPTVDWIALGAILREVVPQHQHTRHGPPEPLLQLAARLNPDHIATRPLPEASELLAILDRLPSRGNSGEFHLLEGARRGFRSSTDHRALLLAAIAGVLVMVWFLVRGA